VPGRFTQCVTNYAAQRKANGRTFSLSRAAIRIVAATRASGWSDWTTVLQPTLGAFGEVDVDTSRAASSGVLSILYQRSSSGTTPSRVRVADLELG
jgi:hypothetical protein